MHINTNISIDIGAARVFPPLYSINVNSVIDKFNQLIAFSKKLDNFYFVSEGYSIKKVVELTNRHLWNDIDVYCNYGNTIFWVDNINKIYYAFKFKDKKHKFDIENFIDNIIPVKKKLKLSGYDYCDVNSYVTRILVDII